MRRFTMLTALLLAAAALQSPPVAALANEPSDPSTFEAWDAQFQTTIPGIYPVGVLTPSPGLSPRGIAIDPATGYLWTVNRAEGEIVIFDHSGTEIDRFGTTGTGTGQLSNPQDIAFAGEEVFITEEANHRVQVFDKQGNHLRMWGSMGSNVGQFTEPCGVTIVGNFVFVADAGNDRIQKFTKAGGFVDAFGSTGAGDGELDLACSGSYLAAHGDEVFVTDIFNSRVAVFDTQGTWERNITGLGTPTGIDADDTGQIWVGDDSTLKVHVFSTTGVPIGEFGGPGSGVGALGSVLGIAVDPGGKTVWVHEDINDRVQVFTTTLCAGQLLTHVGTSYDDVLSTGDGDDVVALGEGRDTVVTAAGDDIVCGGPGNDNIKLGVGADRAFGHKGQDVINGGGGNDRLEGSQHRDKLNGGGGSDLVKGGSGNDTLNGGNGPDTLLGGSQDDLLNGNKGNDDLKGGKGNDTCKGGAGNDTASGCETQTGIDLLDSRLLAYRNTD